MTDKLQRIDRAAAAIERATTVAEAKEARAQVAAIEKYFKEHKENHFGQNRLFKLKLRADRKLGKLIPVEFPKRHGRPKNDARAGRRLQDIGISSGFADRCRMVAKILEAVFEKKLALIPDDDKPKASVTKEATTGAFVKMGRKTKRDEEHKKAVTQLSEEAKKNLKSVSDLRCCSFEKLLAEVKPDAVITDPPYAKEFIPIYEDLAKVCRGVPLVAVMCGHSYLPEIIPAMAKHLKYRWMLAYLTPGGQAAQQWQAKVNTFWKPVLLFGDASDWIGDVVSSETNDNDKDHHQWGQSESGMAQLVERLTSPGQLVCDPFMGGGTTAVVCFRLGRKFVGCDIDPECVTKARERIQALV